MISNRQQNIKKRAVDYIDKNEDFYLNGNNEYDLSRNDQCDIQNIQLQEHQNSQKQVVLPKSNNIYLQSRITPEPSLATDCIIENIS